jgi:hypothetical protein
LNHHSYWNKSILSLSFSSDNFPLGFFYLNH